MPPFWLFWVPNLPCITYIGRYHNFSCTTVGTYLLMSQYLPCRVVHPKFHHIRESSPCHPTVVDSLSTCSLVNTTRETPVAVRSIKCHAAEGSRLYLAKSTSELRASRAVAVQKTANHGGSYYLTECHYSRVPGGKKGSRKFPLRAGQRERSGNSRHV